MLSIIARPKLDGGWEGRYCRVEGYPSHQVSAIFRTVNHHFQGDVVAAQRYFIEQHQAGWYYLGGDVVRTADAPDDYSFNRCSCYGDHSEFKEPLVTDLEETHALYVYVLEERVLRVLFRVLHGWREGAQLDWTTRHDWEHVDSKIRRLQTAATEAE